jgi:RAP1 GTPase activating protein 1
MTALRWGFSLQSLIVPGKSPTRKKSGPFGSRRSSAIGIENIQEVQEKRWVRVPGERALLLLVPS